MKVQKISAITLKIQNMKREWKFYSKVPGLTLTYGGPDSTFTTFEMKDDLSNSRTYLNLEFTNELTKFNNKFGRIVIYADNVDKLYHYFKNDENITNLITIKNEPRNGEWGERYFHILDPEEYELSFAQIINQN